MQAENKYQKAISVITREQEKIIGRNLSRSLISGVANLKLDNSGNPVLAENANSKQVLKELVDQYATLFGQASVEVAKEAVENSGEKFAPNELPENLK